jgi:uncharacterized protein (DUF302 family)
MTENARSDPGIVRIPSLHGVKETADRLEALLRGHNVLVFARIDFSGDAARAELTMRPQQLLVFGNPKAGTPLMVAAPQAGLDLPLKALIWEDEAGKTWLAYNAPGYVLTRHGLPESFAQNLSAVIPLLQQAAAA